MAPICFYCQGASTHMQYDHDLNSLFDLNPRRHRGGGGVMQPPAVFLEYLFCLPVEYHHFFYNFPPIFFTSPVKILRPWIP